METQASVADKQDNLYIRNTFSSQAMPAAGAQALEDWQRPLNPPTVACNDGVHWCGCGPRDFVFLGVDGMSSSSTMSRPGNDGSAPPGFIGRQRLPSAHRGYHCIGSECSRTFNQAGQLRKHYKRKHLPASERPFGCDVCPRRFTDKKDLRRHMKVHAGASSPKGAAEAEGSGQETPNVVAGCVSRVLIGS